MRVTSRNIRIIPLALPNTGAMANRRRVIWIRNSCCCALFFYLVIQMHTFAGTSDSRTPGAGGEGANESTAAILSMVPSGLHKYLTTKPKNNTIVQNATTSTSTGTKADDGRITLDIREMRRRLGKYNAMQTVLNEDTFGPLQNDSIVIVIQVHTRITYLRHLIVSLAQAQGISEVLLVFSHDYYDEDINDLVQSVDFCKVMQIFYPFSIQTHPHEFPGEDPGDCPRNINKETAILKRCNNALYPDLYGHYREAKFTQTKHHWWWKANRVFNQLEVTRYHTGHVVFLEEDHYVAPDFLHVLWLMQGRTREICPKCNVLSLGTYLKTYNYYGDSKKKEAARLNSKGQGGSSSRTVVAPAWSFQVLPSLYSPFLKVEVTPWVSSKHNMGMAFNRSTWLAIVRCAIPFCSYDDYNWDWSLQHLSYSCLENKLHAMVVRGPRVFHIGECGVHHKKTNCASTAVISRVQQVLRVAANHLFPSRLQVTLPSAVKKHKLRKGNGGWGDMRDHTLCVNMTIPHR